MSLVGLNLRLCRICGASDFVFHEGAHRLIHYSVRSYAHYRCLVAKHGVAHAESVLPLYMRKNREIEIDGREVPK
jgi:hypothetical protein